MGLRDEDKAAIKRVAKLLIADHDDDNTKATILEMQMLKVASHNQRSGGGALASWVSAARSLAKHLLVIVEEQQEVRRNLKI